jgi:hypothetical protein
LSANQTTSFFLVSGLGSGAYSAKLFAGTKQRFSGFSHIRQCGDDVLRMFVTGGPPVRGGGGMPQRIMTNSRSLPELRKSSLPTCWRAPDPPVRRKNQNRLIGPSIVPSPQFSTARKTQWHDASLIKFANFQIAIFRRELDR